MSYQQWGTVIINDDDTIGFLRAIDFAGSDTLSYTISDREGESEKTKISVIVKAITDSKPDRVNHQIELPRGNKPNKKIKHTKTSIW